MYIAQALSKCINSVETKFQSHSRRSWKQKAQAHSLSGPGDFRTHNQTP